MTYRKLPTLFNVKYTKHLLHVLSSTDLCTRSYPIAYFFAVVIPRAERQRAHLHVERVVCRVELTGTLEEHGHRPVDVSVELHRRHSVSEHLDSRALLVDATTTDVEGCEAFGSQFQIWHNIFCRWLRPGCLRTN